MDPEVLIFQDLESLSRAAARIFFEQAEQALTTQGYFLVVLNGGSTPVRLFQLLASDKEGKLDWNKTHFFWGDERCVQADDPESNFGQASKLLLRRLKVPEGNLHRIKGELSPAEGARDYAMVLKQFAPPHHEWPRFDLVLLGMGEDGHIASLFPGSPVESPGPTLAVTAHYQDRPAERVTLTPKVFNDAKLILFMVVGSNKASSLSKILSDTYQPDLYPAQRIKPNDGKLIWLVDEAAAGQLLKK